MGCFLAVFTIVQNLRYKPNEKEDIILYKDIEDIYRNDDVKIQHQ